MRDAEIDAFLCVIRAQLAQLEATNDRGAKLAGGSSSSGTVGE